MNQFISAMGLEGMVGIYYSVALAAFMVWLFLPIEDTYASLIANVLGWISAIYVFFLTYGAFVFDIRQGSPVPFFDIPAIVSMTLSIIWPIPLAAFFLFGRVLGRLSKRLTRGR